VPGPTHRAGRATGHRASLVSGSGSRRLRASRKNVASDWSQGSSDKLRM